MIAMTSIKAHMTGLQRTLGLFVIGNEKLFQSPSQEELFTEVKVLFIDSLTCITSESGHPPSWRAGPDQAEGHQLEEHHCQWVRLRIEPEITKDKQTCIDVPFSEKAPTKCLLLQKVPISTFRLVGANSILSTVLNTIPNIAYMSATNGGHH